VEFTIETLSNANIFTDITTSPSKFYQPEIAVSSFLKRNYTITFGRGLAAACFLPRGAGGVAAILVDDGFYLWQNSLPSTKRKR
jgi:hypothetical protein